MKDHQPQKPVRSNPERAYNYLYVSIVLFYVIFGITQCFWFQPFSADEPAILDPAIQFATGNTLTIPSAGPGSGHSDAYFYQLPLHALILGLWLKMFGISALSAQLFSFALGFLSLLSLNLFRKSFGIRYVAIAALFLISEKTFFGRMTMIRYDGISMLFALLSIGILIGPNGFFRQRSRWLLAGVCVSIATMSNFLYGIYALALPVSFVLSRNEAPLWEKIKATLVFSLGGILTTIPLGLHICSHFPAFNDQFIFQIVAHRSSSEPFITAELRKYSTYYARHYFAPLLYLIGGIWLALECRKRPSSSNYGAFPILAAASTLLLTLASGSKHWHQSVVSPSLVLLSAGVICHALELTKEKANMNRIAAKGFILLGCIAACSGLVNSPIRMTVQSLLEQGSRSHKYFGIECNKYIPDYARVYGPRQLLINANFHKWDFVADYGDLFRTDPDLGKSDPFEWIVCRVDQPKPEFFDPEAYQQVHSFRQPSAIFDRLVKSNFLLRIYFYSSLRYEFAIYRKKSQSNP